MPYALLSDIHGNMRAFEAVLAELARFEVVDAVVLGDVAQGGDEPAAVLDRLAELGWPVILGNADHFLLEIPADPNEELTEEQLARRTWSLAQLDERHLEQIRGMHPTYARDGLLAFHGSPRNFEDILFPETDDLAPWLVDGYDLLAGGHTHVQWTTRIGTAVYVLARPLRASVRVEKRVVRPLHCVISHRFVLERLRLAQRRPSGDARVLGRLLLAREVGDHTR
jgi:predicted phosphodiesterase